MGLLECAECVRRGRRTQGGGDSCHEGLPPSMPSTLRQQAVSAWSHVYSMHLAGCLSSPFQHWSRCRPAPVHRQYSFHLAGESLPDSALYLYELERKRLYMV